MKNILGANWRTTATGVVTVLAAAIYAKPDLIEFLPDSWEPIISGVCGLLAVVSGGTFAVVAKDRSVTGGTQPNDPPALNPTQAKKHQADENK